MVKLILGLGSNAGNRLSYLRKAVKSICKLPGFDFLAISSVYDTEPWGFKKQNNFLNCVLVCLCRVKPEEALKMLRTIEISAGRKQRAKWQKREIDIDILFYGHRVIKQGSVEIPHAHIAYRNFVLEPLAELMPRFVHPLLNASVEYLYRNSPDKNRVYLYSEKI